MTKSISRSEISLHRAGEANCSLPTYQTKFFSIQQTAPSPAYPDGPNENDEK